jgi:hypothetical protein
MVGTRVHRRSFVLAATLGCLVLACVIGFVGFLGVTSLAGG